MAIDFTSIQRVLLIKLRHHGDVLLCSPLPHALRARHPHLEVDALVYADTAPMLAGHPDLQRLHVIDKRWREQGWRTQLGQEWALLQTLRSRRYDLILHLTESWRGAALCRLLQAPYAAVAAYPRRRHSRFWRNSFSHHAAIPGRLRHTVEKHLDLLRVLGLQPAVAERQLILTLQDAARARIDAQLRAAGLNDQPFILIHPTSRWMFKCWDEDKLVQLIDRLHADGHAVVLSCAPDARELASLASLQRALRQPPRLDLGGQLQLPELAALIARAELFIGVDSAPMHMAAALGTPCIALFGPSGDLEWGPYTSADKKRILTADADRFPCRPCGLDGCAGSKHADCLSAIPVSAVTQAIAELRP